MATSEMELGKPKQGGFFSEVAFMKWHFVLCGIGLIGFADLASQILAAMTAPKVPFMLNDYIVSFFFPQKRFELAYFIFGSVCVFSYWMLLPLVLGKYGEGIVRTFADVAGSSRRRMAAMLLADFVVSGIFLLLNVARFVLQSNMGALADHSGAARIANYFSRGVLEPLISSFSLLWLLVFSLPVVFYFLTRQLSAGARRVIQAASVAIMVFVVIQFVHMFKPFVFDTLMMKNEYYEIPSTVYVKAENKGFLKRWKTPEKDAVTVSHFVDLTSFLNERLLWWPIRKYDVNENPGTSAVNDSSMCLFASSPRLAKDFVGMMHDSRNFNYYFDVQTGNLCSRGIAPVSEMKMFGELSSSPVEPMLSTELHYSTVRSSAIHSKRVLKADEKQVLLNHVEEMHWQILNRWVIHHHNFMLGTVNELALGRPVSEINTQYGILNALVVGKLLNFFGGITYHSYFKVYYSFYYVYYILFLLLVWHIFRRVEYLLAVALLSFAGYNFVGYQVIFLGPGTSPIRHFLDLFVVFCLVRYFCGGRAYWLFASLALAVSAILNNKEFGLFLLLSTYGALVIRMLNGESSSKKTEFAAVALSAVAAVALFCLPMGRDALSKYYLAGLLGFRLKFLPVFALLLGFSACCFILAHFRKAAGGFKYVAMFLLFYSQQLLVYYVWGSAVDHFFVFLPMYALAGFSLLKLCADASPSVKMRETGVLVLSLGALLCVYGISVLNYYLDKHMYLKNFRVHKTYEWNLPRAKFISTMDPSYFERSVSLIQKYATGNGIYMISKYDAFLPFLSTKYQAMPFPEVSQFLVTKKEMEVCVDALKRDRPTFLFVDANIDRDWSRDIINASMPVWGYLNEESRWRVERLSLLQQVWKDVRASYEKVDSGGLLDVYRLKQDAPVPGRNEK